ncbi:hypothetical protein ACPC54_35485 [Kitasatospora sp. NPDC094028]
MAPQPGRRLDEPVAVDGRGLAEELGESCAASLLVLFGLSVGAVLHVVGVVVAEVLEFAVEEPASVDAGEEVSDMVCGFDQAP